MIGMGGLENLIHHALNHLLREENWALERLRPYSGSQVLVTAGPINLTLRVDEHGLFVPADSNLPVDVVLTLPADAPVKLLLDRSSLFSSVKLSGSADFAESLAFVFRNLRWDVESDLAAILGDIPARRLTKIGAHLKTQVLESVARTARNVVEFATEDSSLLAAPRDIQAFGKAIDNLRDDTARLEKRVKLL